MFDAYKVAVKLTLVNHVSTGLISITQQLNHANQGFHGAQAGATLLEKKLLDIKRLGLVGGALAAAGFGGLALMKGPLEEAKKFDQQVGKFRLFGLGEQVTQEASAYAKSMNVMGSSAVDNMRLMNEAQGVFRESGLVGSKALEGAKLAAPMLAKIHFATESLDDESKARMRTQSMSMLRFVEMRGGLKDASTFNAIADAGWKAIQSSGGNVNWEQLRQFMARGGVAAQGLTDTSLFGKLEPIIGELKGSTAGNAWMTAYNRLVGGVKIPNQAAHLLAENGIWDKSRIEWNTMGGIKRFKDNPLKDMATFSADPAEFYEKDILPMYARMNQGKGLSTVERARENTMIFGRTGGMMFSLIDRQLETIHRSVAAQGKALGVDKSVDVAKDTLAGKELILAKNWKNLQLALGETILPLAIKGIEGLNSVLNTLIRFTKDHPTTVKVLTVGFVGLAAAMAFGGTVMLMTAGFKGIGLALDVLGAPAGTLARATTAVGVFGKGIGALGALAAAWTAGQFIGGVINDHLSDGTKDKIGHAIATVLAPFSKDAREALDANGGAGFGPKASFLNDKRVAQADAAYAAGWKQPPKTIGPALAASGNQGKPSVSMAPPASSGAVQVNTQIHLDGRKVAESVTRHQAKDMARAPAGPNTFDGSMNLRALGTGFAGG